MAGDVPAEVTAPHITIRACYDGEARMLRAHDPEAPCGVFFGYLWRQFVMARMTPPPIKPYMVPGYEVRRADGSVVDYHMTLGELNPGADDVFDLRPTDEVIHLVG